MKFDREFYVLAHDDLRKYMNELLSQCKDEYACDMDVYSVFGIGVDRYRITDDDYYRIREYIKSKKQAKIA